MYIQVLLGSFFLMIVVMFLPTRQLIERSNQTCLQTDLYKSHRQLWRRPIKVSFICVSAGS